MFKLDATNYTGGLEEQAIQALCALKLFSTIAPPVTEAAMRSLLETLQLQAYSDAGWGNFMSVVGNLPLIVASLTNPERSIVNTIREAITPTPQEACCGIVVPSAGDGLTAINGYIRTGSATWETEMVVTLNNSLSCNIKRVKVTLTPGASPAITTANPMDLYFTNCDPNAASLFSVLWVKFAANPSGLPYDVLYTFYDSDNVVITSYNPAYTFVPS